MNNDAVKRILNTVLNPESFEFQLTELQEFIILALDKGLITETQADSLIILSESEEVFSSWNQRRESLKKTHPLSSDPNWEEWAAQQSYDPTLVLHCASRS